MNRYTIIATGIIAAIVLWCCPNVKAQNSPADSLSRLGDECRMNYEFSQAAALYRQALKSAEDSLKTDEDSVKINAIKDRILMAENGANMLNFAYKPNVIAKKRFSIDDFFLYYPMENNSWLPVPNILDSLTTHPFAKAIYIPDGEDELYYSAPDKSGVRNIWKTEDLDSLWSAPELLNESLVSEYDEIYPVLSDDGKSLYFSSKGLYGVGGYDLYVSNWNTKTKDWNAPVNLGFPYSSPYDDLLYYSTPDGRYTVFASNRECSADSVYVYVLEYDAMPIHSKIDSTDELRTLMKLDSSTLRPEERQKSEVPESEDTKRYMAKMSEVRALRDTIYAYGIALEEARAKFALSDDVDERAALTRSIIMREELLPMLRDSLDKVSGELQAIEMEFLFNGVVIDPDKVMAEAEKEVPKGQRYEFSKKNFRGSFDVVIAESDQFDYSFMVLPEGRFAQDNTLPAGIVYQIQIFAINRKAKLSEIKGLSPVFYYQPNPNSYRYSVGLFRKYNEALSHLNQVKRVGFREAYIVAFNNGKPIAVSTARNMEK